MKSSSLSPAALDRLRSVYAQFSADPIERVRVRLRRYRAREIRERIEARPFDSVAEFETEVWRFVSRVRVGDRDWSKLVFDDDTMTAELAGELSTALDDGNVDLAGNFIWHVGSSKFGPNGTPDELRDTIERAERILKSETLAPLAKVRELEKLHGIGEGTATGLGMIWHPREVSIFNGACKKLAANVGAVVSSKDEYQRFALELRAALGCEDLLELDWLLYQIDTGKFALPTGHWLFQSGDEHFDLPRELEQLGDGGEGRWNVTRDANKMSAGDDVLLWRAGPSAGVYAIARLLSKPVLHDGENPTASGTKTKPWHSVPYQLIKVLSPPISKAAVAANQVTANMLVLRAPAATSVPVTPAELEEILKMADAPSSNRFSGNQSVATDLNVIYYGPPGTGKTYTTAAKAVEIVDGVIPATRAAVMDRLAHLRDANQVAFVTFHQSYSYEEFVEGIRPVLAAENEEGGEPSTVEYECRPGIFRSICEAAQTGRRKAQGAKPIVEPGERRIWKLSLGNTHKAVDDYVFDDSIEGGVAVLGYGGTIDFRGADTKEEVVERLRKRSNGEINEFSAQVVHRFKNEMAVGDLVVVSDGNRKFRAIGEVIGDYELLDRERHAQARRVRWLFVPETSLSCDQILRKVFSQATFYELKPAVVKMDALRSLLTGEDHGDGDAPRRYVLVIDEINRGNISKILGELITLLEPDKRLGATNELRVRLPYSQDEFGIPANLHIVGTMNTADRSIAFLDTALRRRFRFEEMMPDAEVVRANVGAGGVLRGVDVAALLECINERIELLYDRDHVLGHAYFLGLNSLADLRELFVYKIVPLLQEYFYDDWSKIAAVLGCGSHDGPITAPNAILSSTALSADVLIPGTPFDGDARIRYAINPAFRAAAGDALAPFFANVMPPSAP